MKHNFNFETENLILSPLCEKHVENLRNLRNRPENREWFFDSAEITREAQRAWFAAQQEKSGDYMFAVSPKESPDEFLGAVAIYKFDSAEKSYDIGRLLLDNRKTQKRGLGTELVAAACRIGFDMLHAKALHAEAFAENLRSISCFTNNGFSVTCEKEISNRKIVRLTKNV